MAGRSPLYADADIRGQVIEGLIRSGWDLVRAVDIFPQKTKDPVHCEDLAREDDPFPTGYPIRYLKPRL